MFYEFYTKIIHIEARLNVSRKTASAYLIELEKASFFSFEMIDRDKIYFNQSLF